MTDLHEKRVLVAEDDYFLAQDIREEISRVGATVIGPAASLERAFALTRDQPIDVEGPRDDGPRPRLSR